jgi:hypothetical protein
LRLNGGPTRRQKSSVEFTPLPRPPPNPREFTPKHAWRGSSHVPQGHFAPSGLAGEEREGPGDPGRLACVRSPLRGSHRPGQDRSAEEVLSEAISVWQARQAAAESTEKER